MEQSALLADVLPGILGDVSVRLALVCELQASMRCQRTHAA